MSCERRAAQQALSSMTFIVSWLAFKSFIHFEFTLVCGVIWWFSVICAPVQLSQHRLLKTVCAPLARPGLLCQILIDHKGVSLFLGSLSCSR